MYFTDLLEYGRCGHPSGLFIELSLSWILPPCYTGGECGRFRGRIPTSVPLTAHLVFPIASPWKNSSNGWWGSASASNKSPSTSPPDRPDRAGARGLTDHRCWTCSTNRSTGASYSITAKDDGSWWRGDLPSNARNHSDQRGLGGRRPGTVVGTPSLYIWKRWESCAGNYKKVRRDMSDSRQTYPADTSFRFLKLKFETSIEHIVISYGSSVAQRVQK